MSASDSAKKPVVPRPAATVVLVREGLQADIEVYLLKRSAKSGFMPGNYVFPGGTLDPQDRETAFWAEHVDLGPDGIWDRLGGGLPAEDILAYSVAVVRETFEEAGVFLGERCSKVRGRLAAVRERRTGGGLDPLWLRDLVGSGDWKLALSALGRWSHWVTPDIVPQRFDTRFFLALSPEDQECAPDARETTHGLWIRPRDALEGNLRGEVTLSPPTLANLHDLLAFNGIGELQQHLKGRPWGPPRSPRPVASGRTILNILPWDPMFDRIQEIDTSSVDETPLPVGVPFSRVLLKDGIWRPVAG